MDYRLINKKRPPRELFNLKLKDDQKSFIDSLDVILKEYQNINEWLVFSIHLDDSKKTTVGFSVVGYFEPYDVWIDDIMIDEKYQNKGYGTQAIKFLIDYLYKNYDVKQIKLSCFKENINAIKWYKKLGFIETEERDINGEIVFVYVK